MMKGMMLSLVRSLIIAALLGLPGLAMPASAQAEGLNCLISRGNLCFNTGCNNRPKTQRIVLDLGAGSFRLCPNRFNDTGCADSAMQFDVRDNALIGITLEGPEFAARSVFVNRVTGAITTSQVTAGGVAAVDFGTCEVRR
jgi:hypothetical protein